MMNKNEKTINQSSTISMYSSLPDYHKYRSEYQRAVNQVMQHGQFINGPEIQVLERDLANYVGVPHCIAVSSGTDALMVALMALNIQPGDEVITVAHSWISTVEVIALLGAIPVFVDINPNTFLMDLSQVESVISSRTRALIYVSLYGQFEDPLQIEELCQNYDIALIEDGAQSFGANYNNDNHQYKSCSWGTIGCTSFFPTKPLGAYGDAGACFTRDADLAMKMRAIKNHGAVKKFNHRYIGLNSRMDTIQASILQVKLLHLDENLKKRNLIAKYYTNKFKSFQDHLVVPEVIEHIEHVWAQYSLLVVSPNFTRDDLISELKTNGVNVSIFYPIGLHQQECIIEYLRDKEKKHQIKLPNTEWVCDHVLNLPLYPDLSSQNLNLIVKTIVKFIEQKSK